jgi:hypothetical protein
MEQKIIGFHLDEEKHWVADLECGHKQHMRHDPPWMKREWVLTPEGRSSRLGQPLQCKRCDEAAGKVAEAVRAACLRAVNEAFQEGGFAGLCAEGRQDLALDRLKQLDLLPVSESALRSND